MKPTMTPEELCDHGIALYGQWGWQTKLAKELGVDYSTVKRWVSGAIIITGPPSVALRALVEAKKLRIELEKVRADLKEIRKGAPKPAASTTKKLPRRGKTKTS